MTPLVLDTHAWIWLMEGDGRYLSNRSRRRIEQSGHEGLLVVSAISLWEVSMLDAKGRVRLGRDCLGWIKEALTAPGISLAALSPEIAVESNRLSGPFHGDPADRLIVATTRCLNAILVTKDERILEYSAKGFIKTLEA